MDIECCLRMNYTLFIKYCWGYSGEMNIVELLKLFQDFFSFPIPLAVCLIVFFCLLILINSTSKQARKNFAFAQSEKNKVLQDMHRVIESREKRITELEKHLDDILKEKIK